MEPLTVSVKDACRILSIGRTSPYDLMRSGEIKTIKIGRRTLIPTASLKHLVASAASEREAA